MSFGLKKPSLFGALMNRVVPTEHIHKAASGHIAGVVHQNKVRLPNRTHQIKIPAIKPFTTPKNSFEG